MRVLADRSPLLLRAQATDIRPALRLQAMPATDLDKNLNALSYTRYAKEYRSTVVKDNMVDKKRAQELGKHMTLLDGLALLLVDKQLSDVAAVSIRRTNNIVWVLYAMNKDTATTRAGVVNELADIANDIVASDNPDAPEFADRLMAVAPQHCKLKMERRRDKLMKAWAAVTESAVELPVPTAKAIAAFFDAGPFNEAQATPSTWAAWVAQWFRGAVSQKFFTSTGASPAPSNDQVTQVLIVSRLFGRMDWLTLAAHRFDEVACLKRRLSKLGQYMEAVIKILSTAKMERKRSNGSVRFKPELVSSVERNALSYPLRTSHFV